MSDEYYRNETSRLNLNVELAAGDYFSLFHAKRVRQEDLPMERAIFTRTAKSDPLLLWKVAEWWFMEGRKNAS